MISVNQTCCVKEGIEEAEGRNEEKEEVAGNEKKAIGG